jgi:hypothetical protein
VPACRPSRPRKKRQPRRSRSGPTFGCGWCCCRKRLANGLPASINLLVATFKETSIVAIIGFFDFTASAQAAYGTAQWTNAYVEVYLFIGAV